jgi:hypothetical protein
VNLHRAVWLLPLGAFVLIVVSLWTSDPTQAEFAAGGASLLAGGFLFLAIFGRVRWRFVPATFEPTDPLAVLQRSFRAGVYGRGRILAQLDSLDWALGVGPGTRATEGESILNVPNAEFLDYIEGRVREVEART